MTPEQRATLRAAILADPALVAVGRNDTELARLLNLDSAFMVWRSTASADAVMDAILWERFTPADTPDGSIIQTNRLLLCQAKQINLQILLQGRQSIATGLINTRKTLTDALLNVPSGAGGAAQDAGWLGTGRVKPTITRAATVAERVFATGAGTAGNPGDLVFEGQLGVSDVGDVMNG